MKILDVGCGQSKEKNAVGIDISPLSQADIIHNLDIHPWPLPDNSFNKIICRHIVEHIADPVAFMNELHRVAAPRCQIEIVTPHFTNACSYWDPTHKHHFSLFSFDYFLTGNFKQGFWSRFFETKYPIPSFYSSKKFKKLSCKLTFGRLHRWLGLQRLFSRIPYFYEFYLAHMFPARDIYLTLEVIKSD